MSLCRSVDRSGGNIEFSRHVAVSIALNLSSFIYPQLVLDIANLSLDIGTQSMVFSFPGVTMTVGLPICESLTFAFYQSFDLFVIFIEPVLVTFGLNPIASLQTSVKAVLTWLQCSFTVRLSSGFESCLSSKSPLNWLLVSKSLSLPTSSFLLEVCCFRCFGAMRIATLARISLWSVEQAV